MDSVRRTTLIGFAGAAVLIALLGAVAWWELGTKTSDVTAEWMVTFRDEASSYFWIPDQARLVYAEERKEALMGGGFLIVFSLPRDKKPVQWLDLIASKTEVKDCRLSELKFDCGGDVFRLEYIPDRKVFEAEYMWD